MVGLFAVSRSELSVMVGEEFFISTPVKLSCFAKTSRTASERERLSVVLII